MNKLELLKDINSTIGEEVFDPAEPLPEKAFNETLGHRKVLELSLDAPEHKGVWKVFNNLSGLKPSATLMFHHSLLKSATVFFGVLSGLALLTPLIMAFLSRGNDILDEPTPFYLLGLACVSFGLMLPLALITDFSRAIKAETLRNAHNVLIEEYTRQVNLWSKARYGVELEKVSTYSQGIGGYLYLGNTSKTTSLSFPTTEGDVVEAKFNNGWVLTTNVKTSELPLIQTKP